MRKPFGTDISGVRISCRAKRKETFLRSLFRLRVLLKVTLMFMFIGIAAAIYGHFYERNSIDLHEVALKLDRLPSQLKAIKAVHFSDLHFKKVGRREKKLRRLINHINPHILFFTGDLLHSQNAFRDQDVVEDVIAFLGSLSFRRHFFFVFGEDEYLYRDDLTKGLSEVGIDVLDNKICRIDLDGANLNVIGLTDDPKDLDAFYNDDKHHRSNIKRFADFSSITDLKQYRDFRYYVGGQYSLKWANYEVTGQILISSTRARPGIALYSQFPMGIYRSYFVRLDPLKRMFCLTSTGKGHPKGEIWCETLIKPAGLYRFRMNLESLSGMTRIKGKVWESQSKEPDQWQIECCDTSRCRSSMGTVGLSSLSGASHHQVSRINVRMLNYQRKTKMYREGVREVPLDVDHDEMIAAKDLWMTLEDLKLFLREQQKSYLFRRKLRNVIGKQTLDGVTILLSHSPKPKVIKSAESEGIEIILAGDTHGGQIDLPLIDKLMLPSYKGKLLKRGLMSFSGTQLFINRGIGTSVIPIRLNCRPEVTVLSFTSATD